MATKVSYNWLDFYNHPWLKIEWWYLCLKEFSFYEIPTTNVTEKYALRHWEYVQPTLMKNRRVKILFDILANSDLERWQLLKSVQRAFAPEQNPSPFNKNLWKSLTFTDRDWTEWVANCQTSKGAELSDFWNEKWAGISVEVITETPFFNSVRTYENTISSSRWWIKLPTKLWFYWQYYDSNSLALYDWVYPAPITMELTIWADTQFPNDNIEIFHKFWDEQELTFIDNISDLWLSDWDKLIIDTDNKRLYLYDASEDTERDITWYVRLWYPWFLLRYGENTFVIDTWESVQTIKVKITYKKVF